MFHIRCPLGHALEIGSEHFGQRLMCPICQAVVYSSPPRPGERPTSKFEVQCSHGHILRVKEKYLGKEVDCPSCQEKVSMKIGNLLAFSGLTLSVAVPDQVARYKQEQKAKLAAKKQAAAASAAAPAEAGSPETMTAPPGRMPPPMQTTRMASYEHGQPLPPHLASDQFEINRAVAPMQPTVPAGDFEFEIVDTQFKIDMEKPLAPNVAARQRPEALFAGGRIPPPPPPELHDSRLEGTIELEAVPQQSKPTPPPTAPAEPEQIHIHCPNGHVLAIEKQYLGQKIQCPLCQTIIETAAVSPKDELPTAQASDTIQLPCPNGHLLEIERQYVGMQVQCPLCQAVMSVPG